jgi:hypothetical protein
MLKTAEKNYLCLLIMDELVPIASSVERPSLERLNKYLSHHGIAGELRQDGRILEKFQLLVAAADLERAQNILADISFNNYDTENADDVIEIGFDGNERIEVASWLQVLLDEQDHEGSPIYFFKAEFETILDELHASGHVEIPLYILKGLKSFIPQGAKRMQMGQGLQEFFSMIEAVSEGEE